MRAEPVGSVEAVSRREKTTATASRSSIPRGAYVGLSVACTHAYVRVIAIFSAVDVKTMRGALVFQAKTQKNIARFDHQVAVACSHACCCCCCRLCGQAAQSSPCPRRARIPPGQQADSNHNRVRIPPNSGVSGFWLVCARVNRCAPSCPRQEHKGRWHALETSAPLRQTAALVPGFHTHTIADTPSTIYSLPPNLLGRAASNLVSGSKHRRCRQQTQRELLPFSPAAHELCLGTTKK